MLSINHDHIFILLCAHKTFTVKVSKITQKNYDYRPRPADKTRVVSLCFGHQIYVYIYTYVRCYSLGLRGMGETLKEKKI